MTRYRMEGIDCPVCAQGLEDGLRKLDGVKGVTVDFATLTLHVDALDVAAVEAAAKRIEPGLGLLKIGTDRAESTSIVGMADILGIGGATALAGLAAAALALSPRLASLSPALRAIPFVAAWLLAGYPVLRGATRNVLRGKVFDELFLMSIATMGAIAIGAWEEAVGVMVFYRVGELVQDAAIARTRRSIRELLDRKPATARRRNGEAWTVIRAEEVRQGDRLLVLPGELVPVDAFVESGNASIDTKTLSGESAPRDVGPGSEVLGGSLSLDGSLEIRAAASLASSKISRIADLVEEASARKAKTERFITKFAAWYTPLVVFLATATILVPWLVFHGSLELWIYRALVMLVISCPCALVLSIPLGYFAGLGGAARRGILMRGGEVIDALARADSVVFDKTGTLTLGTFEVRSVEAENGHSEREVLRVAAIAEARSRHPLAAAILSSAGDADGEIEELREYPGKGLYARTAEGAILVGNAGFIAEQGVALPRSDASKGADDGASTVVHVALDGNLVGRIRLGDRLAPEAGATMDELAGLGIRARALLTGDAEGPAAAVAGELGIVEARHSLDPEGKLRELEAFMTRRRGERADRGTTLFVGDGTNDAPVLARADVGIAMGGGSDAATGTADVVLVGGGIAAVPKAIRHARRVRGIVAQNVVLALGVKSAFLALGALGLANMWLAVVADVGVALLAVLNATRALSAGRGMRDSSRAKDGPLPPTTSPA